MLRLTPGPEVGLVKLEVRVSGGQHGRKLGHFHFAPAPFAGLLIMPVAADLAEGSLPIHFLLETAKRLLNRLTFLEFDLSQPYSHPL